MDEEAALSEIEDAVRDAVAALEADLGRPLDANELSALVDDLVPDSLSGPQPEDDMNKNQLVEWITANCACWKGQAAALNGLDQKVLEGIKADAETAATNAVIANGAKTGFAVEGVVYTFDATGKPVANAMPSFIKKGKKDDEEEEEDKGKKKVPTGNVAGLTDAEWLAQAPPNIRATIMAGMAANQSDADRIIARLVENKNGDDRAQAIARLKQKSYPELKELESYLPPAANEFHANFGPFGGVDYGAMGGFGLGPAAGQRTDNAEGEQDDVLPLPIVTENGWKDVAREGLHTRKKA